NNTPRAAPGPLPGPSQDGHHPKHSSPQKAATTHETTDRPEPAATPSPQTPGKRTTETNTVPPTATTIPIQSNRLPTRKTATETNHCLVDAHRGYPSGVPPRFRIGITDVLARMEVDQCQETGCVLAGVQGRGREDGHRVLACDR